MRRTSHWLSYSGLIFALVALGVVAGSAQNLPEVPRASAPVNQLSDDLPYVPHTVLVSFKKSATGGTRLACLRRYGLGIDSKCNNPSFVRLVRTQGTAESNGDVSALVEQLKQDPAVAVAEPDYLVRAAEYIPNDGIFHEQWALRNIGQPSSPGNPVGTPDADTDAADAWDLITGNRNVRVAVLDSGIDYNHVELRDNYLSTGFDFVNNDADPADDHGHGTQVAGVIGAMGDNTIGMAGVTWGVRLVAVKVLNNNAVGTVSNVALGVNWAAALTTAGNPTTVRAHVINASFDLGPYESEILRAEIATAASRGVLVVAAAGNNGARTDTGVGAAETGAGSDNDVVPYFPASYNRILDNVISVAASDRDDQLASFSNFGERTVDLAAPGDEIRTTTNNGNFVARPGASGTSLAAAHVTGAAALIYALNPTLLNAGSVSTRVDLLKARIIGGSDKVATLVGKVCQGRRLNIARALSPTDTVSPGAPLNLRATAAGNSSAVLRWIASGDDGSTGTAYAYDLRYKTAGPFSGLDADFNAATKVTLPSLVPAPAITGSPQEAVITGLNSAAPTYFFAIRAIDDEGFRSPITQIVTPVSTSISTASNLLFDDVEGQRQQFIPTSPWVVAAATSNVYTDSAIGTNYGQNLNISLTQAAPVYLLRSQPTLEYTLTSALASGDLLRVEYSLDGGASWNATALRNHSGTAVAQVNSLSLGQFTGQKFMVRFRLTTDGANEADGVQLDNIRIYGQSDLSQPFFDNAEADGLFAGSTTGAPASPWARSADDANTPSPVSNYSDSPGGNYANRATEYMWEQVASVPLGGLIPILTYKARYQLELDRDFAFTDISTDGGVTWMTVHTFNGITYNQWATYSIPLVGAIGKDVRIRFRMRPDNDGGTTQRDGLHIDDIMITGETLVPITGTVPSAPANLNTYPTSFTSVHLDWEHSDSLETGFRLERRVQGVGSFTEIAVLPANQLSYDDSNRSPNTTYEYRIRATNAEGDSPYSNIDASRTSVPQDPTNISATALSASVVQVRWRDRSDKPNAEGDASNIGFVIERSDDNGATFNQLATAAPIAGSFSFTTFDDNSVITGRDYRYRVKARNRVGDSGYLTMTSDVRVGAPLPPGPLTVTLSGVNFVRLDWNDNSTNDSGFIIERSTDADFSVPANIAAFTSPTNQYFDNGPLTLNTIYYYRVRAVNGVGESTNSNTVRLNYSVPSDPSGLTVTVPGAPTGINQLNLAWTDNSDNENNFELRRATDADFTMGVTGLGLQPAGATTAVSGGLSAATTYYFQVRSRNALGVGNWVPATPVAAPAVGTTLPAAPGAVQSLVATIIAGPKVEIRFDDKSTTETSFEVERSTNNGPFVNIATLASADTPGTTLTITTEDTAVAPDNNYRYQVRAVNSSGASAYVGPVTVDFRLPAPPSGLAISASDLTMGNYQIDLVWNDNSDNEGDAAGWGFEIERAFESSPGSGAPGAFTVVQRTVPNDSNAVDVVNTVPGTLVFYRVYAVNRVGRSTSASNVASVRLSVPNAPVGLAATTLTNTRIQLTWTDKADDETSFVVERAPDNMGVPGTWAIVNSAVPASAGVDGTVTFVDQNLAPLTKYHYRVSARNSLGDSAPAGPVSATTLPSPPTEPTNLTATVVSATRVTLVWRDNSNNETAFRIERKTTGGTTDLFTVGANDESVNPFVTYHDDSVEAGKTYTYRVQSTNAGGDSPWSNNATADVTVPNTPTSLNAQALTGTQIRLTWVDNSNNEQGFRIERSADNFGGGAVTVVTTTGAGVTTFTDNNGGIGLTPGTTYYYRIIGFNVVGDSAPSNVAFARTYQVPTAPTGLTAQALSGTQIRLNWTDTSNEETGFRVERKTGAGAFVLLPATLSANATTYFDSGLAAGVTYTYRVFGVNPAGSGPFSNEAQATTSGIPGAPTNLTATALSGTQIRLTWIDNASDELGFKVERRLGAGSFIEVRTLGANTTTFVDSPLTVNTTYTYQVRAYNAQGNSPYSNPATATTTSSLAAPSNLTATALSGRRVLLRWTDNTSTENYFRIERRLGTGAYREIAAVGANVTSFTDSGLTLGSSYTYRVRAFQSGTGGGYSSYSNEASASAVAAPVRGRKTSKGRR